VQVVVDLVRRIDAQLGVEGDDLAVVALRRDDELLAWRQIARDAREVEGLAAGEAERLGALAGHELERQHAHAHQVRAMDALEALGDDRAHAEQARALRGPVAARAGAVLLPGQHHERHASGLVPHGRVVDAHLLAARQEQGVSALFAAQQQVLEADVGEGAAHHHLVVAAARAVELKSAAATPCSVR
jgi:hypothetical protein